MTTEDRRTCYHPDGSEAPNTVPCSDDEYTSCCADGNICMTNGLCISVSSQPYHLSRGGCTDSNWGYDCPEQCLDINPSGGLAIFPLKNDPATYCCGTPISDGDKVVCPVGDENGFEIDSGRIVFGRAGLFNESATGGLDPPATGTAAPGTSPTGATDPSADNSCHQTAVGAGVGVPLGIITLASILWAIWERRKSKAIYGMHRDMPAPSPAKVHELHHDEPRTELDNRKFVPEIMGSERPRS